MDVGESNGVDSDAEDAMRPFSAGGWGFSI